MSKTQVVALAALGSILATIGVASLWKPPHWSASEEAAKRLPAIPPSVIAAYYRCAAAPSAESESKVVTHPERTCDPIVVRANREFEIVFSPITSLQGLWNTSEARVAWAHGPLSVRTHQEVWGGRLFGVGGVKTQTVNPYVKVVIAKTGADVLHKPVRAMATATVDYPESSGSGFFANTRAQLKRQVTLFAVTPQDLEVLQHPGSRPRGTRDSVLSVLAISDVVLVGLLVLGGVLLHHRRRRSRGESRRPDSVALPRVAADVSRAAADAHTVDVRPQVSAPAPRVHGYSAGTGLPVLDLRPADEIAQADRAKEPLTDEDEALAHEMRRLIDQADRLYGKNETAYQVVCGQMRAIGERLGANGGSERMQLVAYRVQALGGRVRDCEQHWSGICGWQP